LHHLTVKIGIILYFYILNRNNLWFMLNKFALANSSVNPKPDGSTKRGDTKIFADRNPRSSEANGDLVMDFLRVWRYLQKLFQK